MFPISKEDTVSLLVAFIRESILSFQQREKNKFSSFKSGNKRSESSAVEGNAMYKRKQLKK